jgi:HlyD family secretion protein
LNDRSAPSTQLRLDHDLVRRLGLEGVTKARFGRRIVIAGAALAVALAIVLPLLFRGPSQAYVTQPLVQGPLAVTVSATGTLAPRDQVDVGAEVSGRIDAIAVDFNDHVKQGEILARINTDQTEAQLAQARATLDQARATLTQDQDTIDRYRVLAKKDAVSPQALAIAEGDLGRARAGVALRRAQVKSDETMIAKATIYSPINGIVLDRKVSVGQTVVAAMQTPVLFTLASDLSQMELDVDIDEADVGQLRTGAQANFTVDAYPSRQFAAKLVSIHNSPKTIGGVVTYRGVLLVANPNGLLKPGMTATAEIEAARVKSGLLVPNSALRFVPPEDVKAKAPALPTSQAGTAWGRLWVVSGRTLAPHDVKLGASDGKRTVILGGDLKEGDAVIVEAQHPKWQTTPSSSSNR